jgi:AGCS family alanine or glycine:cation symporter
MLEVIKHVLSIYLVIPIIFLAGIYFSVTLRFIQFRKIFTAIKYTIQTSNKQQKFSSLGALFAVLGGNLGTGNIAGIAVALATGGPGSLFWMAIMVILGSVIKFCCCFLGIKYREQDRQNNWVGGPMFYLSKGLNCKMLNKIFCVLVICSAVTTGNFIQVNSIVLPLQQASISPWVIVSLIMVFISLVMLGGVKRFSTLVTSVVPLMALFYIIACIKILVVHKSLLIPNLNLILYSAFNYQSLSGAGIGFVLSEAIRVGFDRGIMATDTGIGIAPILHSKVSENPQQDYRTIAIQQGLISMLAPIIVLIICLLTGIVLLVTDAWRLPLQSTQMCLAAFEFGLNSYKLAIFVVNVTLCFFAFTTILTWGHCAESAIQYLFNNFKNTKYVINIFRLLFVAVIPCGILFEVKFLWNLADLLLNFMLLINMYGVCGLFNNILQDMGILIGKERINYAS